MSLTEVTAGLINGLSRDETAMVTQYRSTFQEMSSGNLPPSQLSELYLGSMTANPQNLRAGLLALATEALESGDRRTISTLQQVMVSRVPAFLRGIEDRSDRFSSAYEVLRVVAALSAPGIPETIPAIDPKLLAPKLLEGLKTEERFIVLGGMVLEAPPRPGNFLVVGNSIVGLRPKTTLESFGNTHRELMHRLRIQDEQPEFDEQTLRVAAAANYSKLEQRDKYGSGLSIQDLGGRSLERFASRFHTEPLRAFPIIGEAIQNGFLIISKYLAGLVAGNERWILRERQKMDVPDGPRNFFPLLHNVLTQAKAEMADRIEGEAVNTLKAFIESSLIPLKGREDWAANLFTYAVTRSRSMLQEDKVVIGRLFLSQMRTKGFMFDDLSDQQVLDLVFHNLNIISIDPTGKLLVVIDPAGNILSTVGYFEEPRRNSAVVAEPADISEPAAPPLVERVLTPQEVVQEVLRDIFPGEELSEEELYEVLEQTQNLWLDIEPQGARNKRSSTLNPAGIRLKLAAGRLIKATGSTFPQVELKQVEETTERSDLEGLIHFTSDLAFPFFINRRGILQSALNGWVDNGQLPFDLFCRLNHGILSMAHKKLVLDEREIQNRYHRSVINSLSEKALSTSTNGTGRVSRTKLAQIVAMSEPYLIRGAVSYDSGAVEEITIDREKIIAELGPGQSKLVAQPLTLDELQYGSRRKGRARAHATSGHMVFLPRNQSPRRTAIENARVHNVTLVTVTGFFMDPLGEVITEVVVKTTFRSGN